MRKIKFRAWDIIQKTMHYGSKKPYMYLTNSERLIGIGCDLDPSLYHDTNRSFDKEIILMQYTGLKDKNGKEIYEGDIVVKKGYIWFDNNKPNYRGVVEWIFCQWQVMTYSINKEKSGMSDGINRGLNEYGWEDEKKSDWEVIGNKYENPDLLKKEKK